MKTKTLVMYALAVAIVIVLGSLAGWYFFLQGRSQATNAADLARGFSSTAPFNSQTGSTYQNMLSGVFSGAGSSGLPAGPLPQLWHADKTPVAGFAFGAEGSSTRLSFVERGNGYVFAADPTTQSIARLTNTLLPKVYEAFFTADGGVIERSIDSSGTVTTFAGRIATSTGQAVGTTTVPTTLNGSYLDANIKTLTVNSLTGEIFALEGALPVITGYRMQFDGSKQKEAFSSAVPDWRPMWLPDGRIILLTAPTDEVPGFAYTLQSDGSLESLIRGLPGLTVLPRSSEKTTSPSQSALLYGTSGGAGLSLFAQRGEGASSVLLPIRTIADKCVWGPSSAPPPLKASDGQSKATEGAAGKEIIAYCAVPQAAPGGNFLNDRYKGIAHTADAWWRVDVSTGKAQLIYAPDPSLSLDVDSPTIDATGSYLAFRDARDGSLWVLRLAK